MPFARLMMEGPPSLIKYLKKSLDPSFCNQRMAEEKRQQTIFFKGERKKNGEEEEEARR